LWACFEVVVRLFEYICVSVCIFMCIHVYMYTYVHICRAHNNYVIGEIVNM